MTTPNTQTAPVGGTPDTSGSGGAATPQDQIKALQEQITKLNEHNGKIKGELDNYRTSKTAAEQAAKLAEEKALSDKQEYKTLSERFQKERDELNEKLSRKEENEKSSRKKDAVVKSLFKFGLKETFLDDALKIVDLKKVNVDPDTGIVFGAEEEAKAFYEKHQKTGYFAGPGKSNANHNAPLLKSGKALDVDISKMTQKQKLDYLAKMHAK